MTCGWLCVAMPLYYATGRRAYSFMWGTFSGLTEPLGALIVWGVLKNGMSGNTNGILFGLVSGMMTVISIDELLPTVRRGLARSKHLPKKFLLFATPFVFFFPIPDSFFLYYLLHFYSTGTQIHLQPEDGYICLHFWYVLHRIVPYALRGLRYRLHSQGI